MFALKFISQEVFPLKKSDSAESALIFMEDWQLNELPVVEAGKLLGFVNRTQLEAAPVERVEDIMQPAEKFTVSQYTHIFEIWKTMVLHGFSALAVHNQENGFLGVIKAAELGLHAAEESSIMQDGAVLVIEVEAIHYSLAEISRICEANDAKIIHLTIHPLRNEQNVLQVSLKLNTTYPVHVISSLERFGYKIVFSNGMEDPNHSLEDRYRWLVKYLNS